MQKISNIFVNFISSVDRDQWLIVSLVENLFEVCVCVCWWKRGLPPRAGPIGNSLKRGHKMRSGLEAVCLFLCVCVEGLSGWRLEAKMQSKQAGSVSAPGACASVSVFVCASAILWSRQVRQSPMVRRFLHIALWKLPVVRLNRVRELSDSCCCFD